MLPISRGQSCVEIFKEITMSTEPTKIMKGWKFKLHPNEEQKTTLLEWLRSLKFLWNSFLNVNENYYSVTSMYHNEGRFVFNNAMSKRLTELKKLGAYPFINDVPRYPSAFVLKMLSDTMIRSFKSSSGFPKYKKKLKDMYIRFSNSFGTTEILNFKVSRKYLTIPKLGKIKWYKYRALKGKPVNVTITYDGINFWASVMTMRNILIDFKDPVKVKENKISGVDVGISTFSTVYNGNSFEEHEHIMPFVKYKKKLARIQRRLKNKQRGSNNYLKQIKRMNKTHKRIKNIREYLIHQISNDILDKNDVIILPKLDIKKMLGEKKKIHRDSKLEKMSTLISDAAWYKFLHTIEYKANWLGKMVIWCENYMPFTKTCSSCLHQMDFDIPPKFWECPVCKINHKREENSAINIRNYGMEVINDIIEQRFQNVS